MPSTSSKPGETMPAPLRPDGQQDVLLAALDYYAEYLCEGYCESSWDCAHFDEECGGCLARRVAGETRAAIARAEPQP